MTTTFDRVLLWSPRVLGILTVVFVAMFALDAFEPGAPALVAAADVGVHLLPAILLAGLVTVSFRWPLAGAIGFLALAVLYATALARGRLDWILVISGPLAVVGALFMASWVGPGIVKRP